MASTLAAQAETRPPRVALAGNPNTGKTTLFNRLTGGDQRVGNYPGVTVDRVSGHLRLPGGQSVEVMDVPGSYSLSARSAEEQLAIQAIAGLHPEEQPDLVVVVLDGTQLGRNLYLALQIIETGVPVVLAVNMADMQRARGLELDASALERLLGAPTVAISARRGEGLEELVRAVEQRLLGQQRETASASCNWLPAEGPLLDDIQAVQETLPASWNVTGESRGAALSLWALLSLDADDELESMPEELRRAVDQRREAAEAAGRSIEDEVIRARYGWIDEHLGEVLRETKEAPRTFSERVDGLLLNPAAGFVLFLTIMGLLFQTLFAWADPLIGWTEAGFGWLGGMAAELLPEGLLQDFVVEGLIAGVGSVVVFLPQILLLFLFVGLLEDSGYMARVAFLMDRIMRSLGLHGRAFVPMLSGFACAIPAVMATRTMERRRDRLLTMMVVPLMTCAARLPVYTLLIAALFPPTDLFGFLPVQGLLMVGMYLFSTLIALAAAAVLSRTVLRGPQVPLILELPPYRLPHLPNVLRLMVQKGTVFLQEAGTVILVCTIGLWLLLSFPGEPTLERDYAELRATAAEQLTGQELEIQLAQLADEESGERLRASYGGQLGRLLEPAIEPLGFDWKIGVGLIGAFAAREVFVSTMGIVYGVGAEVDEESPTLRERMKAEARRDGRPIYTPLVGLSLMIFFALACQCMSTVAVVKRETASWRWPLFLFAYMTGLAWLASFLVFQGGRLLGFE